MSRPSPDPQPTVNVARPWSYRPVTIAYGLRASARRTPHKAALVQVRTGEQRSFGELARSLNRNAHAAHALGFPAGTRVALIAGNRLDYVETVAGLSEAGLSIVTLSPLLHAREISAVVQHSGARLVLVSADARERVDLDGNPVPVERLEVEWRSRLERASDADFMSSVEEWDPFAVTYTSGTTGLPKGVLLSHRSRVMMMLFGIAGGYGVHTPTCRALASSPFSTGGGFAHVLAPMFFGGTSYFLERFSAEAFLRAVEAHSIGYASVVPTQMHALLELERADTMADGLESLRVVVSNAAPLAQTTKVRIEQLIGPGKLFDSYGATELGMVSHLRPEEILSREGSVGLPVPGVELRIIDESGVDCAVGEVGRVAVRSPWLFSGYLDDPDATAEALVHGWCTVGDLGRLDADGYLYLVDRQKNVIITGGQNVYAAEVEQVLYSHPAVAEAAVVGVPHAHWGEAVAAVVQLRSDGVVDREALIEHCAQYLARYKLPKTVHFWQALPHNAAGKILHRVIRDRLTAGDGE